MTPDDVAEFLRSNPDFLNDHSEIFTQITVPHPHGGQAITLVERQLQALRDKIRALESKLAELIRFGEENDEIGEKLHRLAVALLEAEHYGALHMAIMDSLGDDFRVPHVAWRLWNTGNAISGEQDRVVSDAVRAIAVELSHPYCGPPTSLEILHWLDEAAPHVRSVAMIPLRHRGHTIGLLLLGSEEDERFYPGMGTLYLQRLGDLVAAVFSREQE